MSDRPQGDRRPDQLSNAKQEEEVRQTFPASDPLSTASAGGARAVPPEEIMAPDDAMPVGEHVVTARFPDRETAKLAIEKVVRDTPLDRHHTEVTDDPAGPIVTVHSTAADKARVHKLLLRCGGDPV